jgi:outer membrane lipoprotein LolB
MVVNLSVKMNRKYHLIAVVSCCLLSACASIAPSQAPINQKMSKTERSQQLSAITEWQLRGAISVTQPSHHFQASVLWEESALNRYTLHFFGPLGVGSAKLSSTPYQTELVTVKGEKFEAATPEELLRVQLGITLPLSDLQYWVRALPAPAAPFKAHYDAYHHITQLDQEGWTIHYNSYLSEQHIDLPKKITLQHGEIKVVMAMSSWQTRTH